MLGNQYAYFGLYKKFITLFGILFTDVFIQRDDANGNRIDNIEVPLSYAGKDKILARLLADPNIDKPAAIVLPRMSFEFNGLNYDSDRMLNSVGKVGLKDITDPNKLKTLFNGVPYNLSWSLYVYVKNEEDGAKIIEQILPYFRPDFTINAELIPEMCLSMDIPIILSNITRQDMLDGSFKDRRVLIWKLDFIMKVYFFGQVLKKPIIKFVNTTIYDGSNNAVAIQTIQPGLTANGQPVNIIANTTPANTVSVPANTIFIDQNWGIIEIEKEL